MFQNLPGTLPTKQPARTPVAQSGANPFARALSETEQSQYSNLGNGFPNSDTSLFRDAMSKAGGSMADSVPSNDDYLKRQQEEQAKLRKRELIKKKLHDQVNPVKEDVFDSQKKRVKEELEKTRQELAMLSKEIAKMRKDVDIATFQQVAEPGTKGTYYISFFQQLRSFIMLLRQRIKSAQTWATQMNAKKKKKGKNGQAMSLDGKAGHEQTKTVFDMMHHEVSNARSGG